MKCHAKEFVLCVKELSVLMNELLDRKISFFWLWLEARKDH